MSTSSYETPQKHEFREATVAALEQAGFVLVDPIERMALPEEFGQNAAVVGDIQARDEEDRLLAFYLVVDASKPLSVWLRNIVRGAHARADVRIYVVARGVTDTLTKSCREVGAGLFALTGRFHGAPSTAPTTREGAAAPRRSKA
jgi:hypothetical protein